MTLKAVDHQTGAVQTTDATQTTLLSYAIPSSSTVGIRAQIVGRKSDGTDHAFYVRTSLGTSASQIGSPSSTTTIESDSTWDATIDVDSGNFRVRVTGANATTIDWVCFVDLFIHTP